MNTEDNGLTSNHGGDIFIAEFDGNYLIVMDSEGFTMFSIPASALPSKEAIVVLINLFNQGYEAGRERGTRDMQYNFRQLLGIKSV